MALIAQFDFSINDNKGLNRQIKSRLFFDEVTYERLVGKISKIFE